MKRDDHFAKETNYYWPGETNIDPKTPISWLETTLVELILFLLVARKANYRFWNLSKSKSGMRSPDIMSVMARDSTIYFAV